jgi:hypothetical protein
MTPLKVSGLTFVNIDTRMFRPGDSVFNLEKTLELLYDNE